MERRLAAILAADVVGYARLMGVDEAGTLERLKSLRKSFVQPQIKGRKGRIVKLMGDGLLAEFPSVVEAVQCAVDIQEAMIGREPDLPDERRIKLRVGINLGDIIVEGDDIYGDGVNVAARLEALATPGEICVSGAAFDAVEGKLDLAFEDMGLQDVKNIAKPIRAFRLRIPGNGENAATQVPPSPVADRLSIAVLPFVNMSGDPEQEYFSDGITEDIITELARFNSLFVIARNSSFHYKDQSPNVIDVGRELGVQYVVEGSIRKAGRRVRITAQLVETATGSHIWAERYDRDLEDIFTVQDEVVREIVTAVPGRLDVAEIQQVHRRPAENLTAYDYMIRAGHLRHQEWGSPAAADLLEKAIAADPQYALAYAHLSNWHAYSLLAHGAPAVEARRKALAFAETALNIEPNDSTVLGTLAEGYLMTGDLELARKCLDKAVRLNPNDYQVMSFAGVTYAYLGDIEEALHWHDKILRHDPISIDAIREASIEIYYMAGRYDDAIRSFVGWQNPSLNMLAETAAAYAQAGRLEEAGQLRERYLASLPEGFTFADHLAAQMKMCARQEHRDMWIDGYRKAGFEIPKDL